MTERDLKRLVIDANVARAAGGGHPKTSLSKNCRDALVIVRSSGHCLILNRHLIVEWGNIMSPFSRKWLVEMKSAGKLDIIADTRHDNLRGKIERVAENRMKLSIMQKDLALIETALRADKSVISCDEEARELFHQAAVEVHILTNIVWVNPDKEDETPMAWLQEGAQPEPRRMLGYLAPVDK